MRAGASPRGQGHLPGKNEPSGLEKRCLFPCGWERWASGKVLVLWTHDSGLARTLAYPEGPEKGCFPQIHFFSLGCRSGGFGKGYSVLVQGGLHIFSSSEVISFIGQFSCSLHFNA